MTEIEIAYLGLVIGAMAAFVVGLGFVTWEENRSRSRRS